GTTSMERRQSITESYLAGSQIGFVVISCSAAVLALAALGTFVLVLDTRHVTLRQINASLALITQRLEWLQDLPEQGPGGRAAPSDSPATGGLKGGAPGGTAGGPFSCPFPLRGGVAGRPPRLSDQSGSAPLGGPRCAPPLQLGRHLMGASSGGGAPAM